VGKEKDMLVTTSLNALAAGEQVSVGPGDILKVSCSFKYIVARATTVTLWASLGLGLGRDIESFKEISLEAALTPRTWEGDIDINIPTSDKTNGTYWLRAEVEGYGETQVTIDDAVVISGYTSTTSDLMGMVMAVMVMGLMTSSLEGI